MFNTTKKREREVAEAITDMLFAEIMMTNKQPSLNQFAHAFGTVCKEQNFVADDASCRRITAVVLDVIRERQRAADKLNVALLRSTADLMDMRAKLERAARG